MAEKPVFGFKIEPDLKEALDRAAVRFGVTTADLVRNILRICMGVPREMDIVLAKRIADDGVKAQIAQLQQGRAA